MVMIPSKRLGFIVSVKDEPVDVVKMVKVDTPR